MKSLLMQILGNFSPRLVTSLLYIKTFHKKLNLKNPKSLNEKIQWIKFYGDTTMWAIFADKLRVRDYVKQKGYAHILVKLYGSWTDANKIEWQKLPNSFVLKTNNGCGDITIVNGKNKLNLSSITKYYNGLLKQKFGVQTGQMHYRDIKPCIIAEELLTSEKQKMMSTSLIDYKFWCFNGEPKYIFVCCNRTKQNVQISLYDINWNDCSEYLQYSKEFLKTPFKVPRPVNLKEMITISKALSEGHPQMRVDLYEVNDKIYFGELTLTSACGLMTYFKNDFLDKLGEYIKIV